MQAVDVELDGVGNIPATVVRQIAEVERLAGRLVALTIGN